MYGSLLSRDPCLLGTRLSVAVSFLILVPAGHASTVTIDSFDAPNPGATFFFPGEAPWGAGCPAGFEQAAPGVAGGERDVYVEVVGTPESISAASTIGYEEAAGTGLLRMATFGLNEPGSYLIVQYDGTDADPDPSAGLTNAELLGSLDLTGGGTNDTFQFAFRSVDAGNGLWLNLTIRVTGAGGLAAVYEGRVPESGSPFVYTAAFDEFAGDDAFSAVTSLTFAFNQVGIPTPNVDFELDSIAAAPVPEPSALAVLSVLGALMLVARVWSGFSRRAADRLLGRNILPR